MLIPAAVLLAQLATPSPTLAAATAPGYGPWQLGMTKEQVQAIAEFGPYTAVQSTGGLETKNGSFANGKTNISFVFGERGLRIVQIWAYEGKSIDEALAAFYSVYSHLEKTRGAVETPGLTLPSHADRTVFIDTVRGALASLPAAQGAKIQIAPVAKLPEVNIFSSLIFQQQIRFYYVFLYYRLP